MRNKCYTVPGWRCTEWNGRNCQRHNFFRSQLGQLLWCWIKDALKFEAHPKQIQWDEFSRACECQEKRWDPLGTMPDKKWLVFFVIWLVYLAVDDFLQQQKLIVQRERSSGWKIFYCGSKEAGGNSNQAIFKSLYQQWYLVCDMYCYFIWICSWFPS